MHSREEFQKIARSRVKEDKPSRRNFLKMGAAATVAAGALVAFPLLKRFSDNKLVERSKETSSGIEKFETSILEEIIKEANESLGEFENKVQESQKDMQDLIKEMDDFEAGLPENPRNPREVDSYEQTRRNVIFEKTIQKEIFLQFQNKLTELMDSIVILLSDKELDTQGLLQKWESGEYLEKKTRIEKIMKSFSEQYQETDKRFDALINKVEEGIKKGREKLENKKRPVNIA